MERSAVIELETTSIIVDFYVRKELDQARVEYFMGLYQAGVALPPPHVMRTSLRLAAGRHRLQARLNLGYPTTLCKYVTNTDDRLKQVALAIEEDMQSALPLKAEDIMFTMRNLLEGGAPNARVAELFRQHLPGPMVRKYLKNVHSLIWKNKVNLAVRDVAEGEFSVSQAAKQHGIDLVDLKAAISGKKRQLENVDITKINSRMSTAARAFSNRCRIALTEALNGFEDGDVSEEEVSKTIKHFENVALKIGRNSQDFRARFTAMTEARVSKKK